MSLSHDGALDLADLAGDGDGAFEDAIYRPLEPTGVASDSTFPLRVAPGEIPTSPGFDRDLQTSDQTITVLAMQAVIASGMATVLGQVRDPVSGDEIELDRRIWIVATWSPDLAGGLLLTCRRPQLMGVGGAHR